MIRFHGGSQHLKSTLQGLWGSAARLVPGRKRRNETTRAIPSNTYLPRATPRQAPVLAVPQTSSRPQSKVQQAPQAAMAQQQDLQRTQGMCQRLQHHMQALYTAMQQHDVEAQQELYLQLFTSQAQAKNFLELPHRLRRYNARMPYAQAAAAAHHDNLLACHCEAAQELLSLHDASLHFEVTAPAAFLIQQTTFQNAIQALLRCSQQHGSTIEKAACATLYKPLLKALPLPLLQSTPRPAPPKAPAAPTVDDDAVFAAYAQEADATPTTSPTTLAQDVWALFEDQPDHTSELNAAQQQLTQATADAMTINDDLIAQLNRTASTTHDNDAALIKKFLKGVRGQAFAGNIELTVLRELCDFEPDIYITDITATADNKNRIQPAVRNFFANEVQNKYYPLYKRGVYNDASQPRIALLNTQNNNHFELLVVQGIRHYPEQPQYKEAATGERINPPGQSDNNCLYLAYVVGSKLQQNKITLEQARLDKSFAREAVQLRQKVADKLVNRFKNDDFRTVALSHLVAG